MNIEELKEKDRIMGLSNEEFEREAREVIEKYNRYREERKKKYPYGKDSYDRMMSLSDEEFESKAYNAVENAEAAEWYDLEDVRDEERKKYNYYRKEREQMKSMYPYGKEEYYRIMELSDLEFEREAYKVGRFSDNQEDNKNKYEYFRKIRSNNKEKADYDNEIEK